jgi:hypothetical protein
MPRASLWDLESSRSDIYPARPRPQPPSQPCLGDLIREQKARDGLIGPPPRREYEAADVPQRKRGDRSKEYARGRERELQRRRRIGQAHVPQAHVRPVVPKDRPIRTYAEELILIVAYTDQDGRPIGHDYEYIRNMVLKRFPVVPQGAHRGKPTKLDFKEIQSYATDLRAAGALVPYRPRRKVLRPPVATKVNGHSRTENGKSG